MNARMTETFDHVGLFNRDPRLPSYTENATMGANPLGPDYGVFEFGDLFSGRCWAARCRTFRPKKERTS